ncbi:MAG TPA: M48 family metalloprotease [Gemmatimonadaceae bacterium]|nr:M48 family metalloprotease [Gemmatimonadaceae bacterium]
MPTSYAPVVGPADRVHFLDEQRSNRRKSWRFSLLAVLAVAVTGIPIGILVTPLVFTVALIIAHIVNLIAPVPPEVWERARGIAVLIPNAVEQVPESPEQLSDFTAALPAILLLLVPGAIAMLALWLFVLGLLRRAGVGGVLLALGARPPHAGDLEETQLANLVAEMAVAAGVEPPRLMLLDGHGDNAAAVGTSMRDATIVVSRRMLDELDRDQTQAVIGHLIGSVGNGDLRIALTLLSVYQTFGLLRLLFSTAFGAESRRSMWRLVRYAVLPRHPSRATEEAAVADLLLRTLAQDKDDLDRYMETTDKGAMSTVRTLMRAPVIMTLGMASVTAQFAVMISSMLLFGPAFAALWRTRRKLADAMAVQLTRNPTALYTALAALHQMNTRVRGGETVALLFIVRQQGAAYTSVRTEFFDSYHPAAVKRMHRLRMQGAQPPLARPSATARPVQVTATMPRKPKLWHRVIAVVGMIIIIPLTIVAFSLMIVALAMLTMLTLAFLAIALVVVHELLNALFVKLPAA